MFIDFFFVTNFFCRLVITQFSNQLKVKNTSQLINGISIFLQKLLKYFNGTTISPFLFLPMSYFELPNNCIVSFVNNSSL